MLQQQGGSKYAALCNICQGVDVVHTKGLKGGTEESGKDIKGF
jgi:hypothetical protein